MKNVTIILLLLIITTSTFSQQTPSVEKDYMKKSKNQKKTAWIMLGGGATLLLTGIIIPKGDIVHEGFLGNDYENDGIKGAFQLTGVLSMIGSIPFFVASGKNKKRAAAVSFKNEKIPQLYKGNMINHSVPSVNFKVSL